ncbi:MAG: hypothetical protein ABI444_12025 [Candidatus Kapaibacterium sp.]|jgi:UDP-2,3-diacylglucosamine pyrophosphatase LpxH
MMRNYTPDLNSKLTAALTACEQDARYRYNDQFDSVLNIKTNGDDIVIISDLHIGSGLGRSSNFTGSENFFADDALARLLENIVSSSKTAMPTLVINGDFIDYLRICIFPDTPEAMTEWLEALQLLGMSQFTDTKMLAQTVEVEAKEKYGLKTNDFKSVWKLHVAAMGHPDVFKALADWLIAGRKIIVVKGNHDLEWFWLQCRNYLRLLLAESVAKQSNGDPLQALTDVVMPNLMFIDNALILDETLYIEHGHRYENFTKLEPEYERTYKDHELNYPLGSFINRYLLNKVELRYPYYDNIRPRENILPVMIKTDFPFAIKLGFRYIPYLTRSIFRRQAWRIVRQVIWFAIALLVPTIVAVAYFSTQIAAIYAAHASQPQDHTLSGYILNQVFTFFKSFVILALAYPLSRIMSIFGLSEAGSLATAADKIVKRETAAGKKIEIITMGHTHDPEQLQNTDYWFYNTGTWIPILESSSAAVREDKTYTYLHFTHDANGRIQPNPLMRWDDSATRGEALRLIEIQEHGD